MAGEPSGPRAGRPDMPAGYGIDRTTTEGMLSWDAVDLQLVQARNYWVGTTRPDGRPHATPVWGLWLDGAFYFGTDRASRKGRNLVASPDLVVHLESGDDVVILEGVAEEVADPALRGRVYQAYGEKYGMPPEGGEGSDNVLYTVRPRVAYAWRERDFPTSATRWVFREG